MKELPRQRKPLPPLLRKEASWLEKKRAQRGRRALERQLEYQREKALLDVTEDEMARFQFLRSQMIRKRLQAINPVSDSTRVLEVGSGVSGLIFGFGSSLSIGIDPLAAEYKKLYPKLQSTVFTAAAIGEELPFGDASFDIVLSDNVIDHATRPFAIIDEMVRVLRPGGLLFFTVNIHHPVYHFASMAHGAWNALGIKLELSAFADHTVHLTERRVIDHFARLPLKIIEQSSTIARARETRHSANEQTTLFRKLFFKNGTYEILAERLG